MSYKLLSNESPVKHVHLSAHHVKPKPKMMQKRWHVSSLLWPKSTGRSNTGRTDTAFNIKVRKVNINRQDTLVKKGKKKIKSPCFEIQAALFCKLTLMHLDTTASHSGRWGLYINTVFWQSLNSFCYFRMRDMSLFKLVLFALVWSGRGWGDVTYF